MTSRKPFDETWGFWRASSEVSKIGRHNGQLSSFIERKRH
jgi:hypothetical protein